MRFCTPGYGHHWQKATRAPKTQNHSNWRVCVLRRRKGLWEKSLAKGDNLNNKKDKQPKKFSFQWLLTELKKKDGERLSTHWRDRSTLRIKVGEGKNWFSKIRFTTCSISKSQPKWGPLGCRGVPGSILLRDISASGRCLGAKANPIHLKSSLHHKMTHRAYLPMPFHLCLLLIWNNALKKYSLPLQ